MTEAIRPRSITCAHCGAEKTVGLRGPIPTYCSGACRASLKYERSKRDGRYDRELAAARQRTVERQTQNARPCAYCGVAMTRPRRIQCGAEACRLRCVADRMREWQRDYQSRNGAWYRSNYPDSQQAATARRRLRHGHWRALYPERAATYDARRRALVAQARTAEVFAPRDVHTRDNWTCRLCLLPIDPKVAWPDPMSPSVDHVIPLSRGGAHAMHNVQSAHLGCNSRKGNSLMNELVNEVGVQATAR